MVTGSNLAWDINLLLAIAFVLQLIIVIIFFFGKTYYISKDENCALLGYYTVSSGNFLPMFRTTCWSHLLCSRSLKSRTSKNVCNLTVHDMKCHGSSGLLIIKLEVRAKWKFCATTLFFLYFPKILLEAKSITLHVQGVQLKNEPRHIVNIGLTFPCIICVIQNVIYHTLESLLEMTFSDFQTCLTPGERIIRYCLKFLSGEIADNAWLRDLKIACRVCVCTFTLYHLMS